MAASGQPAGELSGIAAVPAETVRRLACDAAISRITSKGRPADARFADAPSREFMTEVSRAGRTIPPATLRALAVRDRGCVFQSCGRPPAWTDAHHVRHWIDGGPTTLENLALLCRRHHRMIHEGGWTLERSKDGSWLAFPRDGGEEIHARSA
jgi:hypothetical protein